MKASLHRGYHLSAAEKWAELAKHLEGASDEENPNPVVQGLYALAGGMAEMHRTYGQKFTADDEPADEPADKSASVAALAKSVAQLLANQLVPTRVSAVLPDSGIRPVLRSGQRPIDGAFTQAGATLKPNDVSLEFEKLFSIEEA